MRMNRFLLLTSMTAIMTGMLSGCGSTNQKAEDATEAVTTEAAASFQAEDSYVDTVTDRGYLIAGVKMDVPGLSFYDAEADTWEGLEIELAYATAGEIYGVTKEEAKEKELVQFVGVTVADREEKLEAGEVDCLFATYTITDERAERFALSESYYTDYIGLMVRDSGSADNVNSLGSDDIRSTADLDGKYIGVPRNATTREAFINYIGMMSNTTVSPIFSEYDSYEHLFKALKDGNIDVMAVDVSILNGYVDSTTTILGDRFAGQHYGAAVLKDHASLLAPINAAIEQ